MSRKPKGELLAARGDDPGADYIRRRLRRRVELERGVTMPGREIDRLLRCLDKAATLKRIGSLHAEVLAETTGPAWALEIEPLLVEMHGEWRYEGRPEALERDGERAARHYAIAHAMDALLTECGFPVVRTRAERLDDAAWFGVPERER